MGIKVIVCGGRLYGEVRSLLRTPKENQEIAQKEIDLLNKTLDAIHKDQGIYLIITGACVGADRLAESWAMRNGVHVATMPAAWATHGLAAGPIRNAMMLDVFHPDLVVAFAGGAGTKSMVGLTRKAGVHVFEPNEPIPQHRNLGPRFLPTNPG